MAFREQSEIDAIHRKVVDTLHRIVSVVGVATVGIGLARARMMGHLWPLLVPCAALGLVVLSYAFRDRLSWFVRSCFILIGLTTAGGVVMWNFGVAAPSGILIPTGIVIAWLIWNRWQAILFTTYGVLAFVAAALKNVHWGSGLESRLPAFNRAPLFWLNLGLLYLAVGAVILGVVRVLFGSFREALLRAKAGELQSKADREKLAGILSGIHDVVFIHEPSTGEILEVHGRVQEMYGFEPKQILAKGVGLISAGETPWNLQDAKRWIEISLLDGPQNFPWRAKRADGTLFWVQVSMQVLTLQGQERLLVTVRDIEDSMRIHQELVSLNAGLEQRVVARTTEIERSRSEMETFSYSVSHDLRAPLRAIDGFARILKEDHGDKLSPEGIHAIDRIVAGANRMGRLTDALLSLSRLDHRPLELRSVDVATIVQEVHDELKDAVGCRTRDGGPCNVRWAVDGLPAVVADPELVRQVFANLMGNACKFTRDKAHPRIWIGTVERPDGIWYEISDNGCGFDMAYADKLFKVFQRLHDDSVEGIGIGLATVKKAIDRLGGSIEAEAKLGEGAAFRFRLTPLPTKSVKDGKRSDSDR